MNVLAKTTEMSREEWLQQRNRGIGGSDVATIFGINKYKSPVGLWLEKCGMVEPDDLSDNEAVYWGNELEEVVAREFERRTGKKVKRRNAILVHPEYSFMLANVDRLVIGERSGLECKTAGWRSEWLWDGDEVPDAYYLQCQHYMAVTGFAKWFIAVLIGGQRFVWKEILRDDAMVDMIIKQEAAFWNCVQNRVRPAIDGSDASIEALKQMHPKSNGQIIGLSDSADFWIAQYDSATAELKVAEERQQAAENALKEMLGDNEAGQRGDRLVTWKSTKPRETFDSKKFKADYPELAPNYINIGAASRRFGVK